MLRSFCPSLLPSSGQHQGFCLMCAMEAHVRKVLCSSASAIVPGAILKNLKCKLFWGLGQLFLFVFPSSSGELLNSFLVIGEEFDYGRQGSAYEFLRSTLSAMHRACLSGSSE